MKKSKKTEKSNSRFIRKSKKKKIVLKTIYFLILFVIVYQILYLISIQINKNSHFEYFGISLLQMKNDYMSKDLNKNDLVITKKIENEELNVDDIIAYKVNNKIRIDKVYKILKSEGAENNTYITKNNSSLYPNSEHVDENEIIGKKVISIPKIGFIINLMQLKITTFFVIIILLLLISNAQYKERKIRQRKYKRTIHFNKLKEEQL